MAGDSRIPAPHTAGPLLPPGKEGPRAPCDQLAVAAPRAEPRTALPLDGAADSDAPPRTAVPAVAVAVSLAAIGTLLGNLSAKSMRRFPRVESLLIVGLTIIGIAGVLAAVLPTTLVALLAAALVNFAAAIGNMAFETIVQRDAPDANRGRALANFATRFQLMWVGAGLVPVVLDLPGVVGFAVVGGIGFAGASAYWFSLSQLAKGSVEVPKLRNYVRRRFTPED